MKSGSLSVYAGYLIVSDGKVRENVYLGIEGGVIKEVSDKPLGDRYGEEVDYSGKYHTSTRPSAEPKTQGKPSASG